MRNLVISLLQAWLAFARQGFYKPAASCFEQESLRLSCIQVKYTDLVSLVNYSVSILIQDIQNI